MRELSSVEGDALFALLENSQFERALAMIIHLASELREDTSEPGSPNLHAWELSSRRGTHSDLTADDLDEPSREQWQGVSVLHLLGCLDYRLNIDWSLSERLRKVALPSGMEYWLVRKHPPPSTQADRIVGIDRHLQYMRAIPTRCQGFRLDLQAADDAVDRRLVDHSQSFTGFVGHFEPGVQVNWVTPHEGFVLAEGLTDPEVRFAAARDLLLAAGAATFFVLPECTVPAALRIRLGAEIGRLGHLAPCLSVVGSFHDSRPEVDPPFENSCEVRDHRGSVIVRVAKTTRASAPHERGRADEFIHTHSQLCAVASSIGLIGVAICLDFCHPSGNHHAAWSTIAPRWMLVPSMGGKSTLGKHEPVARQLCDTHDTVTLVANQEFGTTALGGFLVRRKRDEPRDILTDYVTNETAPLSV